MNVIVYADPTTPAPSRLQIMYAGLDTLEEAAFKFLDPYGTPYVIVDDSVIPSSPYIAHAQTVEIVNGLPVFDWDFPAAQTIATNYNSAYWQVQYDQGLLGLAITNPYQLQLAIATPENERTADQVAAIEFMTGINGLQQSTQDQIDAATTGEELIQILSQLG
jgi:hypothetical protein